MALESKVGQERAAHTLCKAWACEISGGAKSTTGGLQTSRQIKLISFVLEEYRHNTASRAKHEQMACDSVSSTGGYGQQQHAVKELIMVAVRKDAIRRSTEKSSRARSSSGVRRSFDNCRLQRCAPRRPVNVCTQNS
uniref:Uncharacterized protein n=1 Tax=Physcomitrium patens TaxID=3218 RepID=A0A2K1L4M8_PHYPA|nr:hypothetical protein PHYPA_003779 [Physcomitrium patens]